MGSRQRKMDIVDTILRIMDGDDNVNRPATKSVRRTGADQFNVDHHAEYEARGKYSSDKVDTIHQHNNVCPKLHKVLREKSSLVKITTINSKRISSDVDLNCSACAKLMTLRELKRRNVRSKCGSEHNKEYRPMKHGNSGIMKAKSRLQDKRELATKCTKTGRNTSNSTESRIPDQDQLIRKEDGSESKLEGSIKSKSDSSISSYHSYMSTDHEPMIDN